MFIVISMVGMFVGCCWPEAVFLGCLLARRCLDLNGAVVDIVLARDELANAGQEGLRVSDVFALYDVCR